MLLAQTIFLSVLCGIAVLVSGYYFLIFQLPFLVARLAALLVACFPMGKLAVPTTVDHNATTRAGLQGGATKS